MGTIREEKQYDEIVVHLGLATRARRGTLCP